MSVLAYYLKHEEKVSASKIIISLLGFCFLSHFLFSQTTLVPGDIAIVGFKTNATTQSGNDAIKLISLIDLSCGTEFIVTDNNWNGASWACNDDEFGIQITCNTNIGAGSVFYIDVDASSGSASCSGGSITKINLGSPWGSNFGLNSQGDNIYVLQGSRTSPSFIYALKHSGTFASASCSSRDNAALPSTLTTGTTAIQMGSTGNQWNYNFILNSGSKSTLLNAISNASNWASNTSHVWDASNGIVNVSGAYLSSGVLAVAGAGCGCLANCQLAYSGSVNCGTIGVTGNCTAGYQNMSQLINIPDGCTYQVTAEMKNRPYGCSSSGADGDCQTCDVLKVDISGGTKLFQQGASNASLTDSYTTAGPATIEVSGRANRADEIITYKISATPCNCFNSVILLNDLSSFEVILIDKSVKLFWSYELASNLTYFYLEKSQDALNWENFNTIIDKEDGGIIRSYSVYDNTPTEGLNYYRVKYKNDGEDERSSIIRSVEIKSKPRNLVRRINYLGGSMDNATEGIIIEIYDDGTVKKTISFPSY